MAVISTGRAPLILGSLTLVYTLRVVLHLVVVLTRVAFLPGPDEWNSGALPYPVVLALQLVLLALLALIWRDAARGFGRLYRRRPFAGRWIGRAAQFYLCLVAMRLLVYAVARTRGMELPPGLIPLFSHALLAVFAVIYSAAILQRPIDE